jgi:hypothetical protein
MTVSRICDQAETKGPEKKKNMTFQRLSQELQGNTHRHFVSKLAKLKKRLKPFLEWRNTRLAHLDLERALKTKKLPKLSYKRFKGCLKDASSLLNTVNRYKRVGYTGYEMAHAPQGAALLLDILRVE